MNRRPDRRDPLLHDLYRPDDASLPSRMATRIRYRRNLRQAGIACALLVAATFAYLRSSQATRETLPALAVAPRPEPAASSSAVPAATDADLLAHLQHERVIIFTLADGQRQVVWLDGRPGS